MDDFNIYVTMFRYAADDTELLDMFGDFLCTYNTLTNQNVSDIMYINGLDQEYNSVVQIIKNNYCNRGYKVRLFIALNFT